MDVVRRDIFIFSCADCPLFNFIDYYSYPSARTDIYPAAYSIDFRDSAIFILSSLKNISPFTNMANAKVSTKLHR